MFTFNWIRRSSFGCVNLCEVEWAEWVCVRRTCTKSKVKLLVVVYWNSVAHRVEKDSSFFRVVIFNPPICPVCYVTWCPSQYASFGPGMYVIFPADELIYMTYGAALPRIKPRPTLDNLQEPQIPLSTTSSSSLTHHHHHHPSSISNNNHHHHHSQSNYINRQSSQSNYSLQNFDVDSESPPTADVPQRPASRRDSANITNTKRNQPKSDIFGYTTTTSASNSREPSIAPIANGFGAVTSTTTVTSKIANDKNGKPPGKSKNRLHLSLGRLGRSKKEQPPPEPQRLREHHEIRISNPTFTRENLSARNYDAFFESGEPVYSLEYRTPVATPITSIDSELLDEAYDEEIVARPNSLGLFNRSAKPATSRSRSSDPMNRVAQKGDRCLLKQYFST